MPTNQTWYGKTKCIFEFSTTKLVKTHLCRFLQQKKKVFICRLVLMDSNRASVAGLVPEIASWAWNSYMLSGITCMSLMLKFTNMGLQMWKVQMEISLCPWVKYGFHSASFHRAHSQWIDFIGHICIRFYTSWIKM